MPPLLPPPLQTEQQVGDLLDLVGGMITVGLIALVYEGGSGPVPLRWARVPAEMIADMRQSPLWPTLEATAHTLVYDSRITGSMPRIGYPRSALPPSCLAARAIPASCAIGFKE